MSEQKIIQFNGEELTIRKSNYTTRPGRIKLQLYDKEGYPTLTATIDHPKTGMENRIEKDETFIKNYSENQGILEALIKAGYVKDTKCYYSNQTAEFRLVKVLI